MFLPLLGLLGLIFLASKASAAEESPKEREASDEDRTGRPGVDVGTRLADVQVISPNYDAVTPQVFVEQAIAAAEAYTAILADAAERPAGVSEEDLRQRAAQYTADRKKAEKDTLAKWDRDVNTWRDAINAGLELSGIGTVLVPFVSAGASIMKWGAKASADFAKLILRTGDAWSQDWRNNMLGEMAWLDERHVPYPGFQPERDTPRGWCTGLNNQNEPMMFGATALRESFQRLSLTDANNAMGAFDAIYRSREENPYARAMFASLQLAPMPGVNWGAGMIFPSAYLHEAEADPNGGKYLAAFVSSMVAAIGAAVARDYHLETSRYKAVIEAAWHGWDKAAETYQKEFYAQPPGEWRGGLVGVGYAGLPVAAAFAHATVKAKELAAAG